MKRYTKLRLAVFLSVFLVPLGASTKDFNYLPDANGEVVHHRYYSLSYIEEHEVSEWVAHKLTRSMVNGNARRQDNFRRDPLVSTETASSRAYRGSGFDRGHMAPAGDMKLNRTAMSESFYMSNMAPQNPSFNRGIWRELEEQIRRWVRDSGTMYIVTGPILYRGLRQLLPEGVSVPESFYKIVFDYDRRKMIAFLFENRGSRRSLDSFVVSVDFIEELSGIDFFPALPDAIEDDLEFRSYPEDWEF